MRKFRNMLSSLKIYGAIAVTALCFASIVAHIFIGGAASLNLRFLFGAGGNREDSLIPVVFATVLMIVFTLAIALPIGLGCAIYLNEYARASSKWVRIIRLAVETLAGIPSIIYGLFGFIFFVLRLKWSWSLIAGIITLSIMILPIIISSSEESLKSVQEGLREGSYALGGGKFYTIRKVVLPDCIAGILAAVILAIGRVVGESAALILTAGTVVSMPNIFRGGFFSSAATLSVYMYTLTSESADFDKTYATAIVLMVMILAMNMLASLIAKKIKNKS